MTEKMPKLGNEKRKVRVGILASGGGTTAERLTEDAFARNLSFEPTVLVSNNSDARVFERLSEIGQKQKKHIASYCINKTTHPDRIAGNPIEQTKAESDEIMRIMQRHQVSIVLLLGYMRKVLGALLDAYGWDSDSLEGLDPRATHMFNTHPGLLPATAGKHGIHVQEHVIKEGFTEAGQTLHGVSSEYDDSGLIVVENKLEVIDGESPEDLFERVQAVEKANIAGDVNDIVRWKLDHPEHSSFNKFTHNS